MTAHGAGLTKREYDPPRQGGHLWEVGHAPVWPVDHPSSALEGGASHWSKAPLKPKHIWAIRQQLNVAKRVRDLVMFNCALDAKLRACGHPMGRGRPAFPRAL